MTIDDLLPLLNLQFQRSISFWAVLLAALVGAPLIAEDRRAHALPLYFSRPISHFDYVVGKFLALAFFLSLLLVAPPICMYLIDVGFSDADGALVTICARREEHLREVAEQIAGASGADVLAVPADVSRAEDCERFVARSAERFGGIDILVNNAGTSAAAGLEDVDDEAWYADIDLKLMSAVRMSRGVLPHLRARGGGSRGT